jgi:regulator of sirC expression with transglutaminase-like and TPR domain
MEICYSTAQREPDPVDEPGRTQLMNMLAGHGGDMELDRAALTLATIEFPGLKIENCVGTLDAFAVEVAARARNGSGREYVNAVNRFLFQEIGLRGNADDYYDPYNSCLNEVISRRVGIPITLSVLYMEISRRLARPVFGIGLPGHFVVQYNDGNYSTFIDPFHGGELLSADQCYDRAQMTIGDPRVLAPVDKRQILFRMINNLRGIYFSRRRYAKALQVMDLLIDISPDLAGLRKQRALLHLQTQEMRSARMDLEAYLRLAPDADDRGEMESQLKSVVRWIASLN